MIKTTFSVVLMAMLVTLLIVSCETAPPAPEPVAEEPAPPPEPVVEEPAPAPEVPESEPPLAERTEAENLRDLIITYSLPWFHPQRFQEGEASYNSATEAYQSNSEQSGNDFRTAIAAYEDVIAQALDIIESSKRRQARRALAEARRVGVPRNNPAFYGQSLTFLGSAQDTWNSGVAERSPNGLEAAARLADGVTVDMETVSAATTNPNLEQQRMDADIRRRIIVVYSLSSFNPQRFEDGEENYGRALRTYQTNQTRSSREFSEAITAYEDVIAEALQKTEATKRRQVLITLNAAQRAGVPQQNPALYRESLTSLISARESWQNGIARRNPDQIVQAVQLADNTILALNQATDRIVSRYLEGQAQEAYRLAVQELNSTEGRLINLNESLPQAQEEN